MKYKVSIYDVQTGEGTIHEGADEMKAVEKAWATIRTDEGPLSRIPEDFDDLVAAIIDSGAGEYLACELLVTIR